MPLHTARNDDQRQRRLMYGATIYAAG